MIILVALGLFVLLPASGGEAVTTTQSPSALTLTLAQGPNADPVLRAVQLRCDPHGGDHPNTARACQQIALVEGDFTRLRGESGMCTLQYQPVTVTASGTWRGELVSYQETFSNHCTLLRTRGVVFDF